MSHWNRFFSKWTASLCFKKNYEVSLLHETPIFISKLFNCLFSIMAFVNRGKGSSAVKILPEFTFFWDKRYLLIIDLWFSSKSREHWFFWNVISYSCIYLKRIHSKNVTTEAIDRNSWILDADHWFSSKSCENCFFSVNVKS